MTDNARTSDARMHRETSCEAAPGNSLRLLWKRLICAALMLCLLLTCLPVRPGAVPFLKKSARASAGQSGYMSRMKAFPRDDEDMGFWGQDEVYQYEVTEIVFTHKLIDGDYWWDVSEAEDATIAACVDNGVLYVTCEGTVQLNPDSSGLFSTFRTVNSIDFGGMVDTSAVTDMDSMFVGCGASELDLSDWDTSRVKNMHAMFAGCQGLEKLDLSGWDVSSVTDMSYMFEECHFLKKLNLSGWNTESLVNMHGMFSYCMALTKVDMDGWNTENVTNMRSVFSGCMRLSRVDVSKWDTGSVTDLSGMFSGCEALKKLDLSGWNTRKVEDLSEMFRDCTALKKLNLSGWNVNRVTDMQWMFDGCPAPRPAWYHD